ncbi:biliverdin-producing heme oxygenase [Algoriphagus halophytocola]|uniref:Biliverdin-producing heme oxygenase n=1 Tax=Algoriphagus halophytocola TaxID=2991499 RepID=A0ABY6MMB4_9BACT|nr:MULTISPECIES: biliverdin-producing heme oxygenase [unclassified Algoriphagus]UZD23456.1 biliverdin-producing heme oxygenase [Algoriphagus sp. TR-M5]WBL44751.1 biliverdin-producing heme oxygenase [Algoriphagus sp. TR-M9]
MSSISARVPFPKRLKEYTSKAHQELEELPLSKAILDPNLQLSEYLLYLDLMHDVHLAMEQSVFPVLTSEIPDIAQRKKTHLLNNDFRALGFAKIKPRAMVDFWEKSYSKSFAMGMLYVIEGSTLGGKVIFSHVQKNLALDAESGASYFSGYAAQTGLFWKRFIAELTAYEEKSVEGEEIISGANHAFSQIKQHFIAYSHF